MLFLSSSLSLAHKQTLWVSANEAMEDVTKYLRTIYRTNITYMYVYIATPFDH